MPTTFGGEPQKKKPSLMGASF
ncbi:hypothetical protein [Staphylococcus aureus]